MTEQEWTALQAETKRILEESVKDAVKKATVPLLAEITALKMERNLYENSYSTLFSQYETTKFWNIGGWTVSGIEFAILILSWTLPRK